MGRKTSGGKAKQPTDFSHLLEKNEKEKRDKLVNDMKEPV
jgi:hypothetical protein